MAPLLEERVELRAPRPSRVVRVGCSTVGGPERRGQLVVTDLTMPARREHTFVLSIKGRPYTWFRAALERGDLSGVRSAAAELARINLDDALAIVLLMADQDDPAYERAASRWVARLANERPDIGLQELAATVRALHALAGTRPARAALAELCSRYKVGPVVGLSAEPRPPAELALIRFARDRERWDA